VRPFLRLLLVVCRHAPFDFIPLIALACLNFDARSPSSTLRHATGTSSNRSGSCREPIAPGDGCWFCAIIFSPSDPPTLGAAHVLSQETCPFVSCHSLAPSFFAGRDQEFRNAGHGHLVKRCETRELLVSCVWNFQQFHLSRSW
jgi:hypothetical protein